MINPITLKSAISRKHHSQIVLVDSNPTGFRIKRADRATDSEYRSLDFIAVFSPSVSRSVIEQELKMQRMMDL